MIVVTYKKINQKGLIHLPFNKSELSYTKEYADKLYKKGYLNVKVVEMEEKILYVPGAKEN